MEVSYKNKNLVKCHQRDAILRLLMYLLVSAIWNDSEADLKRSANGIKFVKTIQKRKCLLSHLLFRNSV